ncbi:hypothetical protein N7540_012372 [Penicillium herquei]|nr:hypothetical protein N7540_012372 [Penicillium herquei]
MAPSNPETPFCRLANLIRRRHCFTSIPDLETELRSLHNSLQEGRTSYQYLVVTSIPFDRCTEVAQVSQRIKFARFTLDHQEGTLITKIMPSARHDLALAEFTKYFLLGVSAMDPELVTCYGSTTQRFRNWTKEPDASFASQRFPDRLSFVIEIGSSESAGHLQIDAQGWLQMPGSPVELVLTIDISQIGRSITFKQWTQSAVLGRTQSHKAPIEEVESVLVSEDPTGQIYVSGPVCLSFARIVGRPPSQGEGDIVISEVVLKRIASKVWCAIGLS